MVHPVPSLRDMPPTPQSALPLYLAPLFAMIGVLGLTLVSWELPNLLLLFQKGERSVLTLLRCWWRGRMAYSVLALLSPLSFLGLTLLLYWRTARSLDPEVRKETRLAPFLLAPFLLPLVGILMWSALGSFTQCDALAADLRQLEAGDLERMTVLLNERSSPDSLFKDTPEGWQVEQRNALGRTRWVTLRFSDALDFTPDPESFAVAGQTYDWNWTHVQQYEIAYTTQFHLVASAVPVGGPL